MCQLVFDKGPDLELEEMVGAELQVERGQVGVRYRAVLREVGAISANHLPRTSRGGPCQCSSATPRSAWRLCARAPSATCARSALRVGRARSPPRSTYSMGASLREVPQNLSRTAAGLGLGGGGTHGGQVYASSSS